jgi:hypothetical protein
MQSKFRQASLGGGASLKHCFHATYDNSKIFSPDVSISVALVRRVGRSQNTRRRANSSPAISLPAEVSAMRFMMIVKSNPEAEAGVLPSPEAFAEMNKYNDELIKAGVMLAAEGLQPTSQGCRIRYEGRTRRTVIDGPFAESKELIAGFWLIQVKSREEAVEWAKRAPFQEGELELRQVYELSELPPDALPPGQAAKEQAIREAMPQPVRQ